MYKGLSNKHKMSIAEQIVNNNSNTLTGYYIDKQCNVVITYLVAHYEHLDKHYGVLGATNVVLQENIYLPFIVDRVPIKLFETRI